MIFVWALLVAAAVSNASGARIIGGQPTTIEVYPHTVEVESRLGLIWVHWGAGIIVTPRYLISVAQGFSGFLFSVNSRRIRAGSSERGQGSIYSISRRLNHPNYGIRGENDCDITLARLASDLLLGATVAPASIPSQGFEMPPNMPVQIAGWGTTGFISGYSDILRHVTVNTIDNQTCINTYQSAQPPQIVTENMICTSLQGVGAGACDGDWGGPIIYDGIAIGMPSWLTTCGDPNLPGVGTKISAFTDWLIQNAT